MRVSDRQLCWVLIIKNLLITLEKSLADGNRLAYELSRNKEVVRKVEDDREKCTMSFKTYKALRVAMEEKYFVLKKRRPSTMFSRSFQYVNIISL